MDAIEEWTRAQQRVIDLMTGPPDSAVQRFVPACPDWTVRDLLSHMVGLGVDVLAGDEPDDHNDRWTQRQVDERRGRDVATLLDEWRGVTEPLRAWMADNGARPLGDVIIHEQDLRGALGVPGGQETDGLHAIRDRFLDRFRPRVENLAPIALLGDGWQWVSAGDVADAAVALRAPAFDLARALVSRRSARQLRSWTERGDVTPYLDAFAVLGPLPESDLAE